MNIKGADQTAWMHRLIFAFVVHKPLKTGFASRPICCLLSAVVSGIYRVSFFYIMHSNLKEMCHLQGFIHSICNHRA